MIKPAFIFTDHAILQCDRPICVWGECDEDCVTTSFAGQSVSTRVEDGKFKCYLPSMPACTSGELVFESESDKIVLSDVVVGEVWVAGGQSNMEHPTFCTEYDKKRLYEDANIRLFTVPRLSFYKGDTYGFHFVSLHSVDTPWKTCTVDEALNFTAIGYFFARKLRDGLNVPVGIISCNWGATPAEAWTSEKYLLKDPLARRLTDTTNAIIEKEGLENLISRYEKYQSELKEFVLSYDAASIVEEKGVHYFLRHAGVGIPALPQDISFFRYPSALRENMLARIVPYSIRGVIWHQGEANTSLEADSREHYKAVFHALEADWREAFENPSLPFYTVQLAGVVRNGPDADYWKGVRDAQEELAKEENCYMVVSYDLSEPDNIHPAKKQPMGERLAAAALDCTYSIPTEWRSPTVEDVTTDGREIVLHISNNSKLVSNDGGELQGFFVLDKDSVRHKAEAHAENGTVRISCSECDDIYAVEYGRLNYSYSNIVNEKGLSLTPFKKSVK